MSNSSIEWRDDFEAAAEEAEREGRPLLVHFFNPT